MELVFILLIAYLIGSIPFGLLITKSAGLGDVRKIGSGSIGATNVLRTGNKKLAALTLLADAGKGAVIIIFFYGLSDPFLLGVETYYFTVLLIGLAAIIGHCYPVWLKFKGGKGVATAAGVLLAAVPYVGLACCVIWLCAALVSRISSLSALITAGAAPVVTFFLYGSLPAFICFLITVIVFYKHKDNIKRLLDGSEPKIGAKK